MSRSNGKLRRNGNRGAAGPARGRAGEMRLVLTGTLGRSKKDIRNGGEPGGEGAFPLY